MSNEHIYTGPNESAPCPTGSNETSPCLSVGIIAEYNPFHNGHAWQLQRAKLLSGARFAVVVMSPDFVQRGEPAITDKYVRTEMALKGGADLVLELPVCFASGSAEFFAQGAVRILDLLGCVDTLCFGCEIPDITLLHKIAGLLAAQPDNYRQVLRDSLKKGIGFPAAQEDAIAACLADAAADGSLETRDDFLETRDDSLAAADGSVSRLRLHSLLSSPNNILALEYLKALLLRNSRMVPMALPRVGAGYHDSHLPEDTDISFASATAIRQTIRQMSQPDSQYWIQPGILDKIQPGSQDIIQPGPQDQQAFQDLQMLQYMQELHQYIPENSISVLLQELAEHGSWSEVLYDRMIRAVWLQKEHSLESFLDIDSALASRMQKYTDQLSVLPGGIDALLDLLVTKDLTRGRVRRALCHLLLNIRTEDTQLIRKDDSFAYARILGFRKDASELLHHIKNNAKLPLITKSADAASVVSGPALRSFHQDILASHLYGLLYERPVNSGKNEYQHSPVIV